MSLKSFYQKSIIVALCLSFIVITLGAYVRLSDAGLGCPDWPGCYGHVGVPKAPESIEKANSAFPERPVEAGKAWKEMIHRYLASVLGLIIVGIAGAAIALRRKDKSQVVGLPIFLVGLVIFQGMLGMWTVTLLLKPVIVMAHLLGGIATLSCLVWLLNQTRKSKPKLSSSKRNNALWLTAGVLSVALFQVALGGWTSTNYAALACPDFPTCQQQWVPEMDFDEAFLMWRGLGINYEFGVLESEARTAIHWVHRIGAIITAFAVLMGMALLIRHVSESVVRRVAYAIIGVVAMQFMLGIANVVLHLPIGVAVAHNGGAALLIALLVLLLSTIYYSRKQPIGGQHAAS